MAAAQPALILGYKMYWMIIHKQTFEVLSVINYDYRAHMKQLNDMSDEEFEQEDWIRTFRNGEQVSIPPRRPEDEEGDQIGEIANWQARLHFIHKYWPDELDALIGPEGRFFESPDESIECSLKMDKWVNGFAAEPIEPALMPEDTSISTEQFKQTPIFQETERKLKKRVIQERKDAKRARRKKWKR